MDDVLIQKCSTWWFAGKGIPLIAATLGPLANLTSLCAIICTWEQIGLDTNMGRAVGIKDPAWSVDRPIPPRTFSRTTSS